MASIDDRWYTRPKGGGPKVKSPRSGLGQQWRARYRDAAGHQHARHFSRKEGAEMAHLQQALMHPPFDIHTNNFETRLGYPAAFF